MASLTLEVLIDPQPKPENIDCDAASLGGYWFYPIGDEPEALDVDNWDFRYPPVEGMMPARNKHGEWVWQSQIIIGGKNATPTNQ